MKAKTTADKMKRLRELCKQWDRANERASNMLDRRNGIIKERNAILTSLSKSDAELYAEKINRTSLSIM